MKNNDPIRKSLNENLSGLSVSEYRQHNMAESIMCSGVKVKPRTPRRLILAVMLLALSITAFGGNIYYERMTSEDMEWGPTDTGEMALQMLNMEGENIGTRAHEEKLLHDGFKVGIVSGFPVEREFTLMFVLNGHIQPYYYNGELCDYSVHTVEAKGECEVPVSFGELYLTEAESQNLYALVVADIVRNDGSEWVPYDEHDPPNGFNGALTIDFYPESEPNTEIEYVQDYELLPMGWGDSTVIWYGGYEMDGEPDPEGDYLLRYVPSHFYDSADGTFEHEYTTGGARVQLITLVGNAPHTDEDGRLMCLDLKEGEMCIQTAHVEGLESGQHKIMMMQLPIDEPFIDFSYCTDIMYVNVQ